MSFKDRLKRDRSQKTLQSYVEKIQKQNTKGGYEKDTTFWEPTIDASGNGFAILRFLPEAEGEDTPWVQYYSHTYQGPSGSWYWENCPTSIGQACPQCESNNEVWNSGKEGELTVRGTDGKNGRKRKLHYVSNVYIIKDSLNPEAEGKVFKYRYGAKVFAKIFNAMHPQFEDETPIIPFEYLGGADFKLKICKIDGQRSYEQSTFASPSDFLGGDESKIEAVDKQIHPLSEFLKPEFYKSYGELAKKVERALYGNKRPEAVDEEEVAPVAKAPSVGKAKPAPKAEARVENAPPLGDDDDMAFLQSLTED